MNSFKTEINNYQEKLNNTEDRINTMKRIAQINRSMINLKNKKIKQSINFFILTMILALCYLFVLNGMISKYFYWLSVFICYIIYFVYFFYIFNYFEYSTYSIPISRSFRKFGIEITDDIERIGDDIFCRK